jgi:tetratricopeptide (TPR) repeat protein
LLGRINELIPCVPFCFALECPITATQFQDKERQFGSIINALKSDASYTTVYAHALVLRAAARCEAQHYELALADAHTALEVLLRGSSGNRNSLSRLYRMQADAYERLGRIPEAITALQNWEACDASFHTKIRKELHRLQSL